VSYNTQNDAVVAFPILIIIIIIKREEDKNDENAPG
jgi:hypothetical protein